jgi:hypothetical protein
MSLRPGEAASSSLTTPVQHRGPAVSTSRNTLNIAGAGGGSGIQLASSSENEHRCLGPGIRTAVRERIRRQVIRASIRRVQELERAQVGATLMNQQRPATAEREWLVLILDRYAMRVVSAAMRLSDLLNEGVALVERLELPRERFPKMHAVYILRPVADSLAYLRKHSWNDYAALHVYFTMSAASLLNPMQQVAKPLTVDPATLGASDSPLRKLASRLPADLQQRLVATAELDLDLLALDERYFSLDRPFGAVHRLYRPDQGSMMAEMRSQVEQLVTLCCVMGARPIIRYAADAPLAKWMAQQLQEVLLQHPRARNLPFSGDISQAVSVRSQRMHVRRSSWNTEYAEANDRPSPWTLLLADRSYDPLAPILHEFTYQAMVMDVLAEDIDRSHAGGARIRHLYFDNNGREQTREMVIDDLENDALFRTIRFHHMADAIPALTSAFQQFLDTNPAARLQMNKARDETGMESGADGSPTERLDLKQLGAAIRALPQYREQLRAFSLHTYLAGRCMRAFRERHLELVASLEQDLACGRDLDGHRVRREALEQTLSKLFPESGRAARSPRPAKKTGTASVAEEFILSEAERTRLVLIAMLAKYTGQCESAALLDERMMMRRANIMSQSVEHLLNGAKTLVSFRAPTNEYAPTNWWKRRQWRRRERKLHRMRMQQADVPYTLSRYVPAFRSVMQDFADGHLRASEWPLVSSPKAAGDSAQPPSTASTPARDSYSSTDSGEDGSLLLPPKSTASELRERSAHLPRRSRRRWRDGTPNRSGEIVVEGPVYRERIAGAAASMGDSPGESGRPDNQVSTVRRTNQARLGNTSKDPTLAGSPAIESGKLSGETFVERTPRLIIFVAGGISYIEARAAAQVMNRTGQDIIVGGSSMLVPVDYMRALQALDDPEEASRLDQTPIDPELAEALEAARLSSDETETHGAAHPKTTRGAALKTSPKRRQRKSFATPRTGTSRSWFGKLCGACCLGGPESESISHQP